MVSLLLRPLVYPGVPKVTGEAAGAALLRARRAGPNLDFVESIFGNAGDPYQPANDAALDVGC